MGCERPWWNTRCNVYNWSCSKPHPQTQRRSSKRDHPLYNKLNLLWHVFEWGYHYLWSPIPSATKTKTSVDLPPGTPLCHMLHYEDNIRWTSVHHIHRTQRKKHSIVLPIFRQIILRRHCVRHVSGRAPRAAARGNEICLGRGNAHHSDSQ